MLSFNLLLRFERALSKIDVLYKFLKSMYIIYAFFRRMKGTLFANNFYTMMAVNCCHCLLLHVV